jgi:hypothetical protein
VFSAARRAGGISNSLMFKKVNRRPDRTPRKCGYCFSKIIFAIPPGRVPGFFIVSGTGQTGSKGDSSMGSAWLSLTQPTQRYF